MYLPDHNFVAVQNPDGNANIILIYCQLLVIIEGRTKMRQHVHFVTVDGVSINT
jgi:hypothetical protein